MATIKAIYSKMNKWVFWLCLGISVFLLITAFFVPPTAEISPSILGAVSELFAFASLATVISAIDRGVDAKLQKGDTSIHIENPDTNADNNDRQHHRHNDDFQND